MAEQKPEIIDTEKFELDIEIGTSDLVNIGVAEHENNLRAQINVAKKVWSTAKKARVAAGKKCDEAVKKQIHTAFDKKIAAFNKCADALGVGKVEMGAFSLQAEPEKITFGFRPIGKQDSYGRETEGTSLEPIPATQAVMTKHYTLEEAQEEESLAKAELTRLQGELQNMAYVERQMKAQISKAAVLGSKKGQKLLKSLGGAKIIQGLPEGS